MTTGYGVDMWCADSIVSGRLDRGVLLVAHALYRRLRTERGTLLGILGPIEETSAVAEDFGGDEESAYGFDVSGYVGEVGTDTAIQALPGLVRGELMKDPRVSDVVATAITETDAAGDVTITLEIDAVLADSGAQFALTISVDDVTIALLGVRETA